ncbi:MAG: AAA family ATPase, partial [Candidatus Nanoarchaeia archaeon]
LAKDVDIGELASKTEGYSGADIEAVCREAAMLALRENMKARQVKSEHFENALNSIKPSLSKEETERYVAAIAAVKKAANIPTYMG